MKSLTSRFLTVEEETWYFDSMLPATRMSQISFDCLNNSSAVEKKYFVNYFECVKAQSSELFQYVKSC